MDGTFGIMCEMASLANKMEQGELTLTDGLFPAGRPTAQPGRTIRRKNERQRISSVRHKGTIRDIWFRELLRFLRTSAPFVERFISHQLVVTEADDEGPLAKKRRLVSLEPKSPAKLVISHPALSHAPPQSFRAPSVARAMAEAA